MFVSMRVRLQDQLCAWTMTVPFQPQAIKISWLAWFTSNEAGSRESHEKDRDHQQCREKHLEEQALRS